MGFRTLFGTIILVLTIFSVCAQRGATDYDRQWTVVDSLLHRAGLPESALAEVNRIDALARQEHNSAQEIKALIYRVSIQRDNEVDGDTAAMRSIEQRIHGAAQPARSILESVLATLYWSYLQRNRYRLYNREATVAANKNDVATWTVEDFHRRIGELFLSSVQEERLLEQTGLKEWEPVLVKGNSGALRPTLFDVLAHEALDYFKSSEATINEPQDVYMIDDSVVFADVPVFTAHVFGAVDTTSPHYKALLLYQRLLEFHLADTRQDALIDADIDRLGFAKNYSIAWDREAKYIEALQRLTDRYGDNPVAAQAWYLLAKEYAGVTREDGGLVRAKAICERVLKEPDSSEGQANCRQLLGDIVRPTLNLDVEQFNVPGKPFRCLVTWSNVKRVYFRIARIDSMIRKRVQYESDNDWNGWMHQSPVVRSFVQDLPDSGDYLTHTAEIAIGSLPPGPYVLMSSTNPGWDSHQGILTGQPYYVTTIAYIREGRDYFVVNRETGQPITDARAQVWRDEWNADSRKWIRSPRESYHPDQLGHFRLKDRAVYERFFLEFQRPGEDLYLPDLQIPFPYSWQPGERINDKTRYENGNTTVYFFLDRSIYRPGQTVYFKGINITRDYDTRQLKPAVSRKATIFLNNANREKIDSVELTTDAFGAYHGSFRLPDHGLNGRYEIDDPVGQTVGKDFSVEEYKRPRFFVGFDSLKGNYLVGAAIRVTGSAKAYAGNNLDGATVKYRITRSGRYPRYLSFGRLRMPPATEQEIAHGEVKTNSQGMFLLGFVALPDRSLPVSSDPRFDYRIEADVTDINGETRSGSTTIVAGYTVLSLSIGLDQNEAMPADSLRTVQVDVNNLSGEAVASTVRVAAYPLKAPDRLIRERLWTTVPDRWLMTESAFLDSFPHDQYREELQKSGWVRGPVGWEAIDSTRGRKLPLRLGPGWWVIEATTTDSYGHETKDLRYIELYGDKTGRPVNPEYLWAKGLTASRDATPGGTARVETGSSAGDIFLVRQLQRPRAFVQSFYRRDDPAYGGDSLEFRCLRVEGGRTVEDWPVTEADRGGFGLADAFIQDNRLYVHRTLVRVPWDNKELQIRYTTFRDKTEPGSEEKWAVSIGGWRGSRVAAQVLAGMYDASLDQFQSQSWSSPGLYPVMHGVNGWSNIDDFGVSWSRWLTKPAAIVVVPPKSYDRLMGVEVPGRIVTMGNSTGYRAMKIPMNTDVRFEPRANEQFKRDVVSEAAAPAAPAAPPLPVQVRTNFQETAFFFPDLLTDSAGNVSFSFTMPESLTQWKWMTLAHTRDLAFGYSEKNIVTQKQLMVQPNAPRFLREGDKINLSIKVANLTDSEMTGQLGLALTDPTTGETADGWFVNRQPNQYFTVPARGSVVVEFPLDIPYQYNRPVSYRVVAQAGAYSDGEEAVLPVVSNRMLVTETLPLNMPGDGVRTFKFEKLLQSGSSETLNNHALTVEFTANPAWYAVQALPYLMEYPYECAEQTFDRLYANALASKIVNSSPRIAQVFATWRTVDTSALLSNLEKNQELKSILLEETPWVMEGKTETQQKKNIALLFDLSRLSGQLASTIDRLSELQAPDGGFPWFKGGEDDRYVTQYILTGLGRLQRLQVLSPALAVKLKNIVVAGLGYVDKKITEDYQQDLKVAGGVHYIGSFPAQYLYMRSLFNDYGIPGPAFPAVNFYRKVAQQEWVKAGKYLQGMVALALYRTGDVQTARNILASLRETAIRNEEQGMYWKGMEGGYYWYDAPVETSALMIETFREIGQDTAADRQLKTWLLRRKQTHHWPTTKATTDAVYALLMGGSDWLDQKRSVSVQLGDKRVEMAGEAGTGYDKKIFDAPFINPPMGNITVSMSSARGGGSPAWGAVYWQYFDQLDRITPAGGGKPPLRVEKRLYIQRNTNGGPVLDTIPENGTLHIGDRVIVRLVMRADRDLEYVHLKDMRGACMEPVNVLSGYQWQGGLGYYESTKDVSTQFFFSLVQRGVYVFDYPLLVEQTGEFSNGVASVECMYAPEFAFHTEGIRINVEGAQ